LTSTVGLETCTYQRTTGLRRAGALDLFVSTTRMMPRMPSMLWMEENMMEGSLVFSMQGMIDQIMIGGEVAEEGEEGEEEVIETGEGRGVVADLVEEETGHAVVEGEMKEEIEVEIEGEIEVTPEKSTAGGGVTAQIDLTDPEIENFEKDPTKHCKSYQSCCTEVFTEVAIFIVTQMLKNCNFFDSRCAFVCCKFFIANFIRFFLAAGPSQRSWGRFLEGRGVGTSLPVSSFLSGRTGVAVTGSSPELQWLGIVQKIAVEIGTSSVQL